MSKERFDERTHEALAAAERLREALALGDDPIIRDAVIQRFEFTFETVWKALKLFLEHQGYSAPSPRAVLKTAFVEGAIEGSEDADVWLRMLEDRNLTTHAYDEVLAAHAYDEVLAARIFAHVRDEYSERLTAMAQRMAGWTWD
ncbi:MAG: nucleotidyltransferase substrate binding protein [Nitrospirae bacterium]|nr:nucleotidyltransferase substrate binding protein [Fimbriimonadaceae bacterium]